MNVLNGLLIILVAAMVYYLAIPFLHPGIQVTLPAVKETIADSDKSSALPQNASLSDYAVIGDQNLFHPERIVPPEKKEEKAVPKPDLILYGTLITDQISIAFVEDRKAPRTTPGRGKRQTTLHKGDQLSGYILREIEANRIVFAKGEEKIVVLLEDGEKRKTATETQISPATSGMMPGIPQPLASSPAKAGMISGSSQQATPLVSSSLPQQSPPQRTAQTAPSPQNAGQAGSSPSNTVGAPGPANLDNAAAWPTSRRGKLAEVQRRKAERQAGAP